VDDTQTGSRAIREELAHMRREQQQPAGAVDALRAALCGKDALPRGVAVESASRSTRHSRPGTRGRLTRECLRPPLWAVLANQIPAAIEDVLAAASEQRSPGLGNSSERGRCPRHRSLRMEWRLPYATRAIAHCSSGTPMGSGGV
jgi:hypothetical protein